MKMGIIGRWTAGYLVVFLLLVASNGYSVLKLQQLGKATIPNLYVDIQILDYQKKMVDSILSQLRYEQKYLLMHDSGLYDQFMKANSQFHGLLKDITSITNNTAKKESLRKIENSLATYETIFKEQLRLLNNRGRYNLPRYQIEKDKAADDILVELKGLEDYAYQDVGKRISAAKDIGDSAPMIAFVAFVVTLLSAFIMTLLIARSIIKPLTKLVNKTKEISQGVFKSNLKIKSPPEIYELAKAFNTMCDKLSEVDRMKNDFLSMISHELRTPLTTIKEGISLLLEKIGGEITEKQEHLLTILTDETNRLIDLVNSILDLSKMEAGMMSYKFEEASINPLIDQAVTEITPLLEAKGIFLQKELIDNLRAQKIDESRILQVLRNLIANAAKFTPEGGRINISGRVLKGTLEVSVQDSGPGIPPERIPIIFEKFVGSDHKRGTGLGLAIVKHIIDVHGGMVWVESKIDQGSKFTFVLPS
jgi:two-component system, NtrC family, sensor histidine kinase GlrK